MIDPLLISRRSGRPAGERLCVSRGQWVALTGPDWAARLEEIAPTGMDGRRDVVRLTAGELPGDPGEGRETLFVITVPDPVAQDAWWDELAGRLEPALQRGCGVLLGAPEVPGRLPLTWRLDARIPSLAGDGRLRDDFGQPVAHLREGEWGSLAFDWRWGPLSGRRTLALQLSDGRSVLRSDSAELADWKRFLEHPVRCEASFPVPVPAGVYRAAPVVDGAPDESARAEVAVRPGRFHPRPAGFTARWRLEEPPRLTPRTAAALYGPRAPSRIDQGSDHAWLRGLWHDPEPAPVSQLRRWTSAECGWVCSGEGDALTIELEDRRPRGPGAPAVSTLALFIDGAPAGVYQFHQPGAHRVTAEWPGDDLNHEVSLRCSPVWSPADAGYPEDSRRIGFMINAAFVGSRA